MYPLYEADDICCVNSKTILHCHVSLTQLRFFVTPNTIRCGGYGLYRIGYLNPIVLGPLYGSKFMRVKQNYAVKQICTPSMKVCFDAATH